MLGDHLDVVTEFCHKFTIDWCSHYIVNNIITLSSSFLPFTVCAVPLFLTDIKMDLLEN